MDMEKDFESKFFNSKEGRLHYLHHKAEGKTIIFIHGFAGSARTWMRLARFMPETLNVYLIDLIGHGSSDAPDIEYSINMHYEVLASLIESEKLGKYLLFGHSYGGWLAAYFAAQDNPYGIILEDSAGLKEFYDERHSLNPNYKEVIFKNAFAINPREHVLKSMLDADNTEAYLTKGMLVAIESKALIIWGKGDTTVNPKYASVFHSLIKDSKIKMIEGERHTPHFTNPGEVWRITSEFIEKL